MKRTLIIVGVLAFPGLLLCMGVPIAVVEVPFALAFGWASYIAGVLPNVHVNGPQAYAALLGLLTFLLIGHAFAKWLWRETAFHPSPTPGTPGEGRGGGSSPSSILHPPSSPLWHFRRTLAITALILLTFTAGIAATGVAHQSAWLARSDERLFVCRFSRQAELDRRQCDSNLRSIGLALELHAKGHAGRLPDTLEELLTTQDLGAITLICPASNEYRNARAHPITSDAIARARRGHATYVYLARGQQYPGPTTRPLVCEPLTNHDLTGLHILFSDGTVTWHPAAEARKVLSTAGDR